MNIQTLLVVLSLLVLNAPSLQADKAVEAKPISESAEGVTVVGDVKRPSVIRHREGIRLLDCLVASGGFTDGADATNLIVVRRGEVVRLNTSAINGIIVDGKKIQNGYFEMKAGDVVVVSSKPDDEKPSKE